MLNNKSYGESSLAKPYGQGSLMRTRKRYVSQVASNILGTRLMPRLISLRMNIYKEENVSTPPFRGKIDII